MNAWSYIHTQGRDLIAAYLRAFFNASLIFFICILCVNNSQVAFSSKKRWRITVWYQVETLLHKVGKGVQLFFECVTWWKVCFNFFRNGTYLTIIYKSKKNYWFSSHLHWSIIFKLTEFLMSDNYNYTELKKKMKGISVLGWKI